MLWLACSVPCCLQASFQRCEAPRMSLQATYKGVLVHAACV